MADRPPRSTQGNWPPAVFLSGGLAAQSLGVIGRYDLDPAAQCYVLAAGLGTAAAAAAPSVGPRFLRKHTDGLPHGAYCWELSEPEGPLAYCAEHERQPKAFAMAPRTAWNALGRFRGLRVPLLLACTLAPGAAADSGSGSGAHDDLPALVPILGGGGGGGDGACDGATARELGGKKLAEQLFFYPSRDSVLPAFVHGRPVAATTDRGAVSYEHRHFVDRDVLAATEEGRHLLTTLTRPCPPCSAVGGVKEEFVALTDRDDRPRTYVVGMLGDRLRVQIPFPTAGDGGTLTLDLAGVIVLASPPVPLHVSAKALEDPRTSGPAVAKRAVGRAHNLGRTQLGPLAFPERYRAHPYWEFFESVPSLGLCEFMNEAGDVLWAHLGQDLIQWDEGSTSSDASGADGASAAAAAAAWGGAGGVAEATVGLLSVEPRDDRSNAWCFACCHVLPNTEFSNRQLHNRASRRCTQCVVEGLPARGGVGGGSGGGAGSCRGGGGNSGGGRPRAGGGRDGAGGGGDGGGGGGGRGHVRKRSRKGARQRGPGNRGGRPQ